MPKPLEDCTFYTERTADGEKLIGRVAEFPKLRTRAYASALDARDAIVTLTANKLAELQASVDGLKAMPHA